LDFPFSLGANKDEKIKIREKVKAKEEKVVTATVEEVNETAEVLEARAKVAALKAKRGKKVTVTDSNFHMVIACEY
jgi:hypothetical protein